MSGKVKEWMTVVKRCDPLEEKPMLQLLKRVREILLEEPNVRIVQSPVTICGDIHGQFHDLIELFKTGGEVSDGRKYIFMGDYVDRGVNSLETITYLLLLKLKYPQKITLLRGNHECRAITQIYGFFDECYKAYGNANVWSKCCDVFDSMNTCALVDGKIFCVHGGLSPDIRSIDQIQMIDRKREIPQEGSFCDLMWTDPDDIESWSISKRGAGFLFGWRVAKEFSQLNGLELICRAHQLVMDGYRYHFKEASVTTVWSAPNYCYRCGNLAAILQLDEKLNREFKIFKEVEENHKVAMQMTRPNYFI